MTTTDRPAFGDLLARHRRAAGLTQEALAERAGLSARGVSDLERGVRRRPYPATVRLLARALALPAAEGAALLAAARRAPAPPPAGPPAPALAPLPRPPTDLVGREREVAAALGRLREPGVRLLTLTGPGGVGKTRLALAVAAQAGPDFPDGVAFVPLAALADPALVAGQVARALGLRDTGRRGPVEAVARRLGERRLLLVLDNCEHLPEAAPLVPDLLARCPGLRVLATSRAVLRVSGEHVYEVPPLALPDAGRPVTAGDLDRHAAPRLFLARGRAAGADFALTPAQVAAVAALCRRLDGLPLALELAAARARAFPPVALLALLDRQLALLTGGARNLPARQRSLRATLDWSHALLGPAERALFARLAAFAGGATLEAIAAVGAAGPAAGSADVLEAPAAPLEALAALVEHHLLQREDDPDGAPRFRLLEVVREYAAERLAASPDADAVRRRHAEHFLALAEAAEPHLAGAEQVPWVDRLEREHDNLRAALGWALARGETELALRLGGVLHRFWIWHGHLDEGRRWLEAALARGDDAPAPVRAKALFAAGTIALFGAGRGASEGAAYARASARLEESLALYRALGDAGMASWTLAALGFAVWYQGQAGQAAAHFAEGLVLARAAGHALAAGWCLLGLGGQAADRGEYARAGPLLEESVALSRRGGLTWDSAAALVELGLVTCARGDPRRAQGFLAEGLARYRELGSAQFIARTLHGLGLAAYARGDHGEARRRYEESLALHRELDNQRAIAHLLYNLGQVATAEGDPDEAGARYAESLGVFHAAACLPARPE